MCVCVYKEVRSIKKSAAIFPERGGGGGSSSKSFRTRMCLHVLDIQERHMSLRMPHVLAHAACPYSSPIIIKKKTFMPRAAGVRVSLAPRALNMTRRSSDIDSGIVRIRS